MKKEKVNYLVKISILSALAFMIMLLDFPLPLFPSFLQIDLSDIPALIGGFAMGPLAGLLIELIKNMIHLTMTTTLGIGEAANFIVGAAFVVTSAALYRKDKSRKNALISLIAGTLVMTLVAVVSNFYAFIPLYSKFLFPLEAIIGASAEINKAVKDLYTLVVYTIMPFNLLKGVIVSGVTYLMYKKVSPLLNK